MPEEISRQYWYAVPDTTTGNWAVATADVPTHELTYYASDYEVAHVVHESIAKDIAFEHNVWLQEYSYSTYYENTAISHVLDMMRMTD